ncbi:MAG: hypothetical protein ABFS38_05645 [Bacteroidota bacterium]
MIFDPSSPTRDINKRLLLTLHKDGLFDVLAGLIVLTFGLIPILDEAGLNPGVRQVIILSFYALSVLSVLWLKRRITLPRSGYVKLSKKTTSRISVVFLIVNVILFLIFAGIYVFDWPIWEFFGSYQLSVPLGLIFLLMFTVSGALLKAPRFHLYGMLVLIAFLVFEHLFLRGGVAHHGIPLAAFISGGVIILSGCIHLFQFINTYRID